MSESDRHPTPELRREEALFQAAAQLQGVERAAFLKGACLEDPALRARVEALLAVHEEPDTMLTTKAGSPHPAIKLDLPTTPDEAVGQTLGRYKLLEKIGEGGCGVVYVAEQTEPVRRRVALKVIKLGMDTKQVVARFEAERQALAMMDHPNIAKVLDAGTTGDPESSADFQSTVSPTSSRPGVASSSASVPLHGPQAGSPGIQSRSRGRSLRYDSRIAAGRPFFVMELVRGIKITDYCDQANLSTKERVDLFIKVCQAIQHAHQKGIIHRDIKPSNILVTLHDGVPVPKVIDFGIAKAIEGRLTDNTVYTQLHQFIGTPAYMSPEQAEMSGLDIDTRSDIYSLGVLLYELLAGSTPFDAKELVASGIDAMRKTIREQEPPRPSTRFATLKGEDLTTTAKRRSADTSKLLHQLKGDLDWIVMKCLEKDRTRRYESASAVAMDVRRHLSCEPVLACPPSRLYEFQKTVRRHKFGFAAGATVMFALTAGVVGTSLGLFRAEKEKANAERSAQAETKAADDARQARASAESNAAILETNLYFSRIAWAHRESTSQPANVKQAEQLLNECPIGLRDWEWHYLKRRRYQAPLELREFGDQKVHCVAFSPNGRYLAAGGGDGTVKIWDLHEPRLERTLSIHTGFVVSVAFSPGDPALIASAGSDSRLRLWDWQTGREVRSWTASTTKDYGMAYAVAFSPDGRRLAAPGETNSMIIHDIASGGTAFTLPEHDEGARCVTFQDTWIATGSGQASVCLWDATTGRLIRKFGGKGPPITGVALTRNPLGLVALQIDGTVRTWELEPPRELPPYTIRQAGSPSVGLAVHPQAGRIVTGGLDRVVTVSEPATGRQVLNLRELTSACYSLALSPDGNRLAAASRSGSVHVWDATPLAGTEDPSFRMLQFSSDEVWALDLAPNGRSIAVGGYHPKNDPRAPVALWDIPGSDPHRELPGHSIIVFSLAYDPTGRFLATSGDEPLQEGKAKLKVWNLETKKEAFGVEAFQTDERFFSVGFSRDGRWLVAGGTSRKLRVWAAATGRKVGTLGEHANEIANLTFSPDGKLLASIGNDDVVNIWDATHLVLTCNDT